MTDTHSSHRQDGVSSALQIYKKSDIAELHKNIGCDISLLVEIIDELRREGKIEED